MDIYRELRDKHQREVNDFPIAFAFSKEQFEKGMRSFGLDPSETDKIYIFGDTGGFYRRADAPQLHEMFDRHEKERQEAIDTDLTGNGYIFYMFRYELANHEYNYTGELTETLEALDLTLKDIEKSEPLKNGLTKALARYK